MASVTHGGSLPDSSQKTDFYALIDNATVAAIMDSDISNSAAISDSKLASITTASKVSGSALSGLGSIPAGAGTIPATNVRKTVVLKVFIDTDTVTTGDGALYFTCPNELNGMNLMAVGASVLVASTSGLPTISIERGRRTSASGALSYNDMLSTSITIDVNEFDSANAATSAVINTNYDDIVSATYVDVLRVNVDVAGTGTTGLEVRLSFQTP